MSTSLTHRRPTVYHRSPATGNAASSSELPMLTAVNIP
ncbi:hypothetical protein A2U01_0051744, partial [Trifolium medium]|nr:hypothetical protein [Trifolium medium]